MFFISTNNTKKDSNSLNYGMKADEESNIEVLIRKL